MEYVKQHLTALEREVLDELISLAGVGCFKDVTCLNERQVEVVKNLKKKGYVMLLKHKFMVLLTP